MKRIDKDGKRRKLNIEYIYKKDGTKLEEILKNTDVDKLKKRALPRTPKGISPAKLATARMRISNGYSAKEVADSLGVSVDTLYRALGKRDENKSNDQG